jgi:hypothetical protein
VVINDVAVMSGLSLPPEPRPPWLCAERGDKPSRFGLHDRHVRGQGGGQERLQVRIELRRAGGDVRVAPRERSAVDSPAPFL